MTKCTLAHLNRISFLNSPYRIPLVLPTVLPALQNSLNFVRKGFILIKNPVSVDQCISESFRSDRVDGIRNDIFSGSNFQRQVLSDPVTIRKLRWPSSFPGALLLMVPTTYPTFS